MPLKKKTTNKKNNNNNTKNKKKNITSVLMKSRVKQRACKTGSSDQ